MEVFIPEFDTGKDDWEPYLGVWFRTAYEAKEWIEQRKGEAVFWEWRWRVTTFTREN